MLTPPQNGDIAMLTLPPNTGFNRPLSTLLLLILGFNGVFTIKWLSLLQSASIGSIDSAALCPNLSGLTRRQVKICGRNVEVMDSVRLGAQMAVHECQWQFRYNRWNCSTLNGTNLFGKTLMAGTKESAFVHAISSAAVSHAVTRACSSGLMVRCGCDRTTTKTTAEDSFQWSGCSDNIAYGVAFSKSFVDANDVRKVRSKADPKAIVNLQNNEAGRKAIEYQMRIECKCHGASGSCQTKTCWRAMPDFRAVGATLKARFDSASEVRPQVHGRRTRLTADRALAETDLVFLRPSPDFCDGAAGGTRGRECDPDAPAGCALLCCGRGYARHVRRVVERCNCKFHWCCHVTCRECESDQEAYRCL